MMLEIGVNIYGIRTTTKIGIKFLIIALSKFTMLLGIHDYYTSQFTILMSIQDYYENLNPKP